MLPRRLSQCVRRSALLAGLAFIQTACQGLFHGEGRLFVWNGTTRVVDVSVDGRTSESLLLGSGSGQVLNVVAGPYHVGFDNGHTATLEVEREVLEVVSATGDACFARADVVGSYRPGKPRAVLLERYPAAAHITIPQPIHVFPGEPLPDERPRSDYGFQRLVEVACDIIEDEVAVAEAVRGIR